MRPRHSASDGREGRSAERAPACARGATARHWVPPFAAPPTAPRTAARRTRSGTGSRPKGSPARGVHSRVDTRSSPAAHRTPPMTLRSCTSGPRHRATTRTWPRTQTARTRSGLRVSSKPRFSPYRPPTASLSSYTPGRLTATFASGFGRLLAGSRRLSTALAPHEGVAPAFAGAPPPSAAPCGGASRTRPGRSPSR